MQVPITPSPTLGSSSLKQGARWLPRLFMMLALAFSVVSCAQLPPLPPRPDTTAWPAHQDTPLGKTLQALAPAPGQSGLRLVTSGEEAMGILMTLARRATRTLDLQYYLVHNEPSTRALLQEVRNAADRGVRVRLLIDDLHTTGHDDALRRLTDHPRIEVRVYNPLPAGRFSLPTRLLSSLTDFGRINRRMHSKMFVADNALALSGGRNLGDAYFLQSEQANFVDLDALVAGPAVRELSRSFDQFWNSELAYPIAVLVHAASSPEPAASELDAPAEPPVHTHASATALDQALDSGRLNLIWARARVLADAPEKISQPGAPLADEDVLFDDLGALLRSARQEVLIISPYFVPGERGLALFQTLRQRGVRVRILTNSLASNDAPIVHTGYARYRVPLLKMGVELHELRPLLDQPSKRLGQFGSSLSRLHAKVLVVDHRRVLVGSMNMDPRSVSLNTEIGLRVNSVPLGDQVIRLYDDVVRSGSYRLSLDDKGRVLWHTEAPNAPKAVTTTEPEVGFFKRTMYRVLGPLAPEEML